LQTDCSQTTKKVNALPADIIAEREIAKKGITMPVEIRVIAMITMNGIKDAVG
jgi:hypothetical protein